MGIKCPHTQNKTGRSGIKCSERRDWRSLSYRTYNGRIDTAILRARFVSTGPRRNFVFEITRFFFNSYDTTRNPFLTLFLSITPSYSRTFSIYLYFYLSIYLSIYLLSTYLSTYQFIYLSIYLSIYLFLFPPLFLIDLFQYYCLLHCC